MKTPDQLGHPYPSARHLKNRENESVDNRSVILSTIQRTSHPSDTHWLVWQTVDPLIRNYLLKERFAGEPSALAGAFAANLDQVKQTDQMVADG
jgi:hypothetical protein